MARRLSRKFPRKPIVLWTRIARVCNTPPDLSSRGRAVTTGVLGAGASWGIARGVSPNVARCQWTTRDGIDGGVSTFFEQESPSLLVMTPPAVASDATLGLASAQIEGEEEAPFPPEPITFTTPSGSDVTIKMVPCGVNAHRTDNVHARPQSNRNVPHIAMQTWPAIRATE